MDYELNLPHYEDLRDKNYLLVDYLASIGKKGLRYKVWRAGDVGDQGPNSSCVGYACDQVMRSAPRPVLNAPGPEEIFTKARAIDNDAQKTGTSLRAGVLALKEMGLVRNYYWADKVDEVLIGVLNLGPVLIGVDWYHSDTESTGELHAAGGIAGNHALVVNGADLKKERFLAVNSFGSGWGVLGTCYIPFSVLNKTLNYAIAVVKT